MSSRRYNLRSSNKRRYELRSSRGKESSKRRCSSSTSSTASVPALLSRSDNEIKKLERPRKRRLTSVARSKNNSPCLLPEIVSLICEYLPLEDRKNVRLTCKLWNESSMCARIIRREKIVFRMGCSFSEIVSSFNLRKNVEFQGIDLKDFSEDTWQHHGDRIRALKFYNCCFNDETIKNIIVHCVNLESLRIYENTSGDAFISHKMLDYLIENNIQCSKLITLVINFKAQSFSVEETEKLLEIFPYIQLFSGSQIRFPASIKGQSERLELGARMQLEVLDTILLEPVVMRLTRFETSLNDVPCTDSSVAILSQFLRSQNELRLIDLEIREQWTPFAKRLMFLALEKCKNVTKLYFNSWSEMQLNCDEVLRYRNAIAKLKFLALTGNFKIESLPQPSSSNLVMKELYLKTTADSNPENQEFFFYIMKLCPNLKRLHLVNVSSDKFLQEIYKTMPELQTLVLFYSSCMCTKYGFTGQNGSEDGLSIKRLQKLERLSLTFSSGYTDEFIRVIAGEFQFPRLKRLKIDTQIIISHSDLCALVSQVPALEILEIYEYYINELDQIDELCKRLRNLRCLFVTNVPAALIDQMARIFEANPRLKFVSEWTRVFWYNPFRKEICITSKDCVNLFE